MRRIASLLAVVLSALLVVAWSAGNKGKEAEKRQQDAEKSPQAVAYRAYVAAVKAGDVEAWKKLVPSREANDLERDSSDQNRTAKEVVSFWAGSIPDEIRFLSVSVKGDKASLRLSGKLSTRQQVVDMHGDIDLVLENGAWKVAYQGYGQ